MIGFVATTMSAFDAVLDLEEIGDMGQYPPVIAKVLQYMRSFAEIVDCGIVGNEDEASRARDRVAQGDCDLLVIWPMNYTLDTVVLNLVFGLKTPLVLLNTTSQPGLSGALDFAKIMENSAIACMPTLTNVLLKNHIDFRLIIDLCRNNGKALSVSV